MENAISQTIHALPGMVLATICVFLSCLLAGWLGSVIAGFRSGHGKGLRLLLIFPVTNPIALLVLLFRDPAAAAFPVACYVVAALSLPLGGALSERIEKGRLARALQSLEQTGERVTVDVLIPEAVPADENVWGHPFLKPLVLAGQPGPEGETARASLSPLYAALVLPQPESRVRYADEQTAGRESRQKPYWDPFRGLHENALAADAGRELVKSNGAPASWEECGALLLEHFKPAERDFAALEEALARPYDRYPYAWEEGFALILPHLAKLKSFTQGTTWRSVARNAQGQSESSYRDLQTAMRLIGIGHSDLLISRLVQWAQSSVTLNALVVGQQYHAWNESRWAALQTALGALDCPGQVPDSMRAERILGHTTISPLLRQSPFEMKQSLDQLGSVSPATVWGQTGPRSALQGLASVTVGGLARAFLTRQWRLALEAYQEFILAVEEAAGKTGLEAWKDLHVAGLSKPVATYGLFARMLLPALSKAFDKSLAIQTQIRLAGVACALERYYLAHDRYPESLDELVPDYLAEPSVDPMTRQPWRYDRTHDRAFRLYSVGANGIDDGGLYTRGGSPADQPRKDDFAWIITEELPPLPDFVVDPPPLRSEGGMQLPQEMMRRYGLGPPEAQGSGPTPVGPE